MKKIITIVTLGIFVGTLAWLNGGWGSIFLPSTVRAFGGLFVDFHVPKGQPLFSLIKLTPGDTSVRIVDVKSGGAKKRTVFLKGIRTGGVGAAPKIENGLTITISRGNTVIYGQGSKTGSKTLANFFSESSSGNGIALSQIGKNQRQTYVFLVSFPFTSGNEFQNKSVIFDLTFASKDVRPTPPPTPTPKPHHHNDGDNDEDDR